MTATLMILVAAIRNDSAAIGQLCDLLKESGFEAEADYLDKLLGLEEDVRDLITEEEQTDDYDANELLTDEDLRLNSERVGAIGAFETVRKILGDRPKA